MEISAPQQGIPIPKPGSSELRIRILQLHPGESLLVTHYDRTTESLQASISYWSKMDGIKTTTRKTDGGLRVWRLADPKP